MTTTAATTTTVGRQLAAAAAREPTRAAAAKSSRPTAALVTLLLALAHACTCGEPPLEPGEVVGDGYASARSVDSDTVEVKFQRKLDAGTVKKGAFAIANFTVVPKETVRVDEATARGEKAVRLETGALEAGTAYTITIDGLKDDQGRALDGTINFTAQGTGDVVTVEIVVDDVSTARLHDQLVVLATVDEDGSFSDALVPYPLEDRGDHFGATLAVQIDAARTVDAGDDAEVTVDRRAYALLLEDGAGRAASALVRFALPDADAARDVAVDILPPIEIEVPPEETLPDPPTDDAPDDGVRVVRVVIDDSASRELANPSLRVAFDGDGNFDSSFPNTLPLSPIDGAPEFDGWWQTTVRVKVDANRVADGVTEDTFPYFAYLVEQGEAHEALDVAITAPDETPITVKLSLGTPGYTPVTFRVDVSRAYLNPSGSSRGVYPDESVFLTGEWQQASDALGTNCGDSFTGGENTCLQMKELADHPGVWQRTLWLAPGRPYGWKVVRCTTDYGCGPLNQLVASSGRAFATVMKNLATDNADAFADPGVGIVDPLSPATTQAGGSTRDYTGASVYVGSGVGSEPDPSGTPDGARMFKQEAPDLVVVVANVPLKTRVIHVGTWRDVNLANTPQEIVDQQLSVDLGTSDYDDGFIGRFPPSREEP
jgi:hypothetical protein